MLGAIHNETPLATLILNFRPIKDWISSVWRWDNMMERLQSCDVPGLPKGEPEDLENMTGVFLSLSNFWCRHVWYVRLFVRKHRSLNLLELDLYDQNSTVSSLQSSFPCSTSHKTCWVHTNANNSTTTKKKNSLNLFLRRNSPVRGSIRLPGSPGSNS